jgi:hypothetical protein
MLICELNQTNFGLVRAEIRKAMRNGYSDTTIQGKIRIYYDWLKPKFCDKLINEVLPGYWNVTVHELKGIQLFYELGVDIPLGKPTINTGIWYYETIKIRQIMEKKYKAKGYPARFFYYVGFFSEVALEIPEGWEIWKEMTFANWTQEWFALELYPGAKGKCKRWREVAVRWANTIELGLLDVILNFFRRMGPYGAILGEFVDTIESFMGYSYMWIPIYESLGFKNTINDVLIMYNWDKIKRDLEQWGY